MVSFVFSEKMFDPKVSKHYDLLSDVISLGLYRGWYRALTRELPEGEDLRVLDLATGTGAIPLSILDASGERISEIVGIDLSTDMLAVFAQRAAGRADA